MHIQCVVHRCEALTEERVTGEFSLQEHANAKVAGPREIINEIRLHVVGRVAGPRRELRGFEWAHSHFLGQVNRFWQR